MNRRWLSARTVQTPVFTACPAIGRDLFPQMFAGAVQPDAEVVLGQTQFRRNRAHIISLEVNALQQFAILLRHGGQETLEALTKQPFLASAGRIGQVLLKPLQGSVARVVTAVEVNDRAAQDPVKPRYRVFLRSGFFGRCQRFYQTLLHHIFGQMRISNAAARERHEGLQVFKQRFFNALHNKHFRRASPARKARTGHRVKINCNESRSRALASVNEDC